MPVKELMTRVENLKANPIRLGSFELGNSLTGSMAPIEEHVTTLDNSQKTKMVNEFSKDIKVIVDVVKTKIADVNTRVNLTMRAVGNQTLVEGAVQFNRVKVPKPKPFCGALDAKALENSLWFGAIFQSYKYSSRRVRNIGKESLLYYKTKTRPRGTLGEVKRPTWRRNQLGVRWIHPLCHRLFGFSFADLFYKTAIVTRFCKRLEVIVRHLF